jgi:hypothetical protein
VRVRHPDYRQETADLPLYRLIQGREVWRELAGQYDGTRLFMLIAEGFKGFDKEALTAPLFFTMVRDEKYSYVYPDEDWAPRFPRDYIVSVPQKEAGPYLVIPFASPCSGLWSCGKMNQDSLLPDEKDGVATGSRTQKTASRMRLWTTFFQPWPARSCT